jgi:hypothetical protein
MPTLIAAIDASRAKSGAAEFNAAAASMARESTRFAGSVSQAEHTSRILAGSLGVNVLRFGALGYAIIKTRQHVSQFLDQADRLYDLSQRFNLPVETLSILGDEAKQAGADIEGVARALQRLSVAETQALRDREGTSQSARAFADLGIAVRDVSGDAQGLQKLFEDVASALASLEDPARQADLAMKLLGRSGGDLIPFLEEFTRGGGFGGKFARVSSETAAAADRWNDAVQRLGKQFDIFLGKLTPAIEKLSEFIDVLTGAEGALPAQPQYTAEFQKLVTASEQAGLAFQRANDALTAFDKNFEAGVSDLKERNRLVQEAIAAQLAYNEALSRVDNFTGPRQRERQFQATGTELGGPSSRPTPVDPELAQKRKEYLQTIADETFAIGKNNLAGQRELLLRKALTLAIGEQDDATKKFLESARSGIDSLTQRAFENVGLEAVKDLNLEIERFGKTAAEVRQLDFDRLFEGFEGKSEVIARAREDFERLNATLQRLGDTKIFEDQVRLMSQAVTLAKLGVDAREEEAAVLELINATQGRITLEQEQQIRALVRARQEADRIFALADDTARALADGAAEAVVRFHELDDVLESIYQQLIRIGAQTFIAQPLQGFLGGLFGSILGNARGNVFSRGVVQHFGLGGVNDRHAYFPVAGGLGEISEGDREEGVFPLGRDSRGRLGVHAIGGGGKVINQTFNIRTNDAGSFKRSRRQVLNDMRRAARDS